MRLQTFLQTKIPHEKNISIKRCLIINYSDKKKVEGIFQALHFKLKTQLLK